MTEKKSPREFWIVMNAWVPEFVSSNREPCELRIRYLCRRDKIDLEFAGEERRCPYSIIKVREVAE